jgi:hypothetical protein
MTSRITIDPISVAAILASDPPNLPTAVRAAETMTMSLLAIENTPLINKTHLSLPAYIFKLSL